MGGGEVGNSNNPPYIGGVTCYLTRPKRYETNKKYLL